MDPKDKQPKPVETSDQAEDLRKANENIREAQGDDATGPVDPKRTGNKPEIDRGR